MWTTGASGWISALTRPRWPEIVLGYEYQFKSGNKSMLDWGQANGENVNIAPSTKAIDEQTHIVKLDVTHDFNGWHLEDNARVEFYTEKNRSDETNAFLASGSTDTQDNYHHVQGMNTLMLEKQIRDWWYLSGGGYYSKLEGSDFFQQTNGAFGLSWNSQEITLRRESEIFSLASLFTPLECLSFSLGTQNEWTREEGFGNAPDLEFLIPDAFESANLDKFKSSQNANLRLTKIPYTVLFADARFSQESDDEFQQEEPAGALTRQTDATNDRYDLRGGFNTSPWRWSDLNAEYRWQSSDSDYNQLQDVWGSGFGSPTNGYPAFILGRTIRGSTFETKLTVRPANWLKTTLSYQISATDYSSRTDPAIDVNTLNLVSPGGPIMAGKNNAANLRIQRHPHTVPPILFFRHIYLQPLAPDHGQQRRPVSRALQRQCLHRYCHCQLCAESRKPPCKPPTTSRAPITGKTIPPGCRSALISRVINCGLASAGNSTGGLSASLRYSFSEYSEPSSGNLNNFTAHGIFATLITDGRERSPLSTSIANLPASGSVRRRKFPATLRPSIRA